MLHKARKEVGLNCKEIKLPPTVLLPVAPRCSTCYLGRNCNWSAWGLCLSAEKHLPLSVDKDLKKHCTRPPISLSPAKANCFDPPPCCLNESARYYRREKTRRSKFATVAAQTSYSPRALDDLIFPSSSSSTYLWKLVAWAQFPASMAVRGQIHFLYLCIHART